MSVRPQPPQWIDKLLERFCAPDLLEEVLGDLHERFYLKSNKEGAAKARKQYWKEVISYIQPYIFKRKKYNESKIIDMDMLRNYFTVAFRNLINKKFYAAINILGLSIGLTCCLLIYLYVQHELSFDGFHAKKDRIYRIVSTFIENGNETNYPSTQLPLGPALEQQYTAIEQAVRFIKSDRKLFENSDGNLQFYEEAFYFADSNVFDVFHFPLVTGNPATALTQPNTVVLSQSSAKRYFRNEDPVGKTIFNKSDGRTYQITGLMEDIPANSHLQFDALLSFSSFPVEQFSAWDGWFPDTYLLLNDKANVQDVTQILADINEEKVKPLFESYGITIDYRLQPLTDIHLKSNFGDNAGESSDISYIYIFAAVAFFIIIIASINYMNLTTARATHRAKEVGVRKTMGSLKSQLIRQFLTESTLLTFISLLLSCMLIVLLLPFFNQLAGKELNVAYLLQPQVIAVFIGITLSVGLAGGSYPAFYLSHFNPALVLKGNITRGTGNALLRKVLVVVQFAVSIAMLICTWVVYDQLQYLYDKDLGFQKEQVLSVTMPDSTIRAHYEALHNRLKNNANVLQVSTSDAKPGTDIFYRIFSVDSPEGKVDRGINFYSADYDFVETMGMHIVAGRNFSRDFPADSAAILVNEAMVTRMQWDDPIGQQFMYDDNNEETPDPVFTVVGVIQNYHQQSLHSPIQPMAIFFQENSYMVNIKIAPKDVASTLAFIADTWAEVNPGKPFTYNFLDQDFQAQYQADEKRGQIFTLFSLLAVVIACLGLLGLAAYTTEQRAKEIGIRKVIGASVSSIIGMIYKDFVLLIIIAMLIAFPLAYLFMNNWLQTFAYQTEIKWFTFVASALLTLIITIGSISFHTLRAATSNPVDSLKNE